MSVKYSTLVWENSFSEGTDRLVMLALADFADDDGECYPGVSRVAKKCRLSKRTVQRSFQTLIEAGELNICKGGGVVTKSGPTNKFTLLLRRGDNLTPGDSHGAEGVTAMARRGDNAVTQTISEPSDKPLVGAGAPDSLFPVDETERKALEKEIPFSALFDNFTRNPLLAKPGFGEAWKQFITDRNQRGKKVSQLAAEKLLNVLAIRGDEAAAALQLAFEKQWTGFKWEWFDRICAYTPNGKPAPKANIIDMAARSQARRQKANGGEPNLFE